MHVLWTDWIRAAWPTMMLGVGGLAGVGALASLPFFWERVRLQIQRVPLALGKPPLRVLHLSDFHLGQRGLVQRVRGWRVARAIQGWRPDVIALTGDFLHDNHGLAALPFWLEMLPPAPLGCWAVLGNHDYRYGSLGRSLRNMASWRKLKPQPNDVGQLQTILQQHGVRLLRNEAAPLGNGWWVAGVDDHKYGQPDVPAALAAVPAGAPLLVLTHHPDEAWHPAMTSATLVLAGHTHGGQIQLFGRTWDIQNTRLPRTRTSGLFRREGGYLYVSSGVGESIPLRWGVPPEVVWIEAR